MSSRSLRRTVLAAAVCGALAACGGSDSGPGGDQTAGIGGTGGGPSVSTVGTVTGFGSVFVNGVEYFTSDDDVAFFEGAANTTSFDFDGEDRTGLGINNDLRIGMVVRLSGEFDVDPETQQVLSTSGVALSISYDDDVEGPVASLVNVSPTIKQFDVLGVTVRVEDGVTIFDDDSGAIGFADIVEGAVIEVSGFFDANDVLIASRVERKSVVIDPANLSGVEVEIKGTVSAATRNGADNGGSFTLTRGGTSRLVEYLDTELDDLTAAELIDTAFVEVKGTLNTDGSVVDASEVELEDAGGFDDTEGDAKVSLEGLVSALVVNGDGGSFSINGQPVSYDSGTVFQPASLRDSLDNDIKVEAEGPVVNQTIVATTIEARSGQLKVEAPATGIDTDLKQITLDFGGQPVTVKTDASTSIRDRSTNQALTLGGLQANQFLAVEAYDDGSGVILATKVDVEEADNPTLRGTLVSVTDTPTASITLRLATDYTIGLDGANIEYTRLDDTEYLGGFSEFFAALDTDYAIGSLIKIELDQTTGAVDEVEVESGP